MFSRGISRRGGNRMIPEFTGNLGTRKDAPCECTMGWCQLIQAARLSENIHYNHTITAIIKVERFGVGAICLHFTMYGSVPQPRRRLEGGRLTRISLQHPPSNNTRTLKSTCRKKGSTMVTYNRRHLNNRMGFSNFQCQEPVCKPGGNAV
ncbi:hypothetical protein ABW19_dt0204461 [Dactylella cylindrospora]|nr:hypothetical protein ABW19_dt0204461 [Dactylella cylindrospora]